MTIPNPDAARLSLQHKLNQRTPFQLDITQQASIKVSF